MVCPALRKRFGTEEFPVLAAAVEASAGADLTVLVVGDRASMFGIGASGEGCDVEDRPGGRSSRS